MADFVYIMANPSKKRVENANGVFTPLREGQVALLEADERHPYDRLARQRRVFCKAGGPPVLAFQTEGVQQKLLEKQIIIVGKAEAEQLITQWEVDRRDRRIAATRNPSDDEIAENELDALRDEKPKRRTKKAQPVEETVVETEDEG